MRAFTPNSTAAGSRTGTVNIPSEKTKRIVRAGTDCGSRKPTPSSTAASEARTAPRPGDELLIGRAVGITERRLRLERVVAAGDGVSICGASSRHQATRSSFIHSSPPPLRSGHLCGGTLDLGAEGATALASALTALSNLTSIDAGCGPWDVAPLAAAVAGLNHSL